MQRARAPTCPRREPAGCPGWTRRVSPVSPDLVRETALQLATTEPRFGSLAIAVAASFARGADLREELVYQLSQCPHDGASASSHRAERALNAWKGQAGGPLLL
jgi:hypothetical protein